MALQRRYIWILVVVFALVAAACASSGSDNPDPTATPDTGTALAIDSDALSVGETIVDRLGPDDGFAAVVLALDRGYDVGQVTNGAETVAPDGTIPDVAPSGPPYGLFAESADAFGGAMILAAGPTVLAAAGGEVTIEDLERALERDFDAGAFLANPPADKPAIVEDRDKVEGFIGGIIALVDLGYTFDQIVEGLVFGEQRVGGAMGQQFGEQGGICIVLANDDGTVVAPSSQSLNTYGSTATCRRAIEDEMMAVALQDELISPSTTTTPPTESDVPDDGVYIGTAMVAEPFPDFGIVESRVEITILGNRAEIVTDITMNSGLEYVDDDVVCSGVARVVDSGVGSAGTVIEIPTQEQSVEVLSMTGECEETPLYYFSRQDGDSFAFTGTYADGTITGTYYDGIVILTATLVP